jgi:hypothetical protein
LEFLIKILKNLEFKWRLRMQRKIIILLAALVVAFMFVGAVSAATPTNAKSTVSATVPTGPQNDPAVTSSGPMVAWEQTDATTGRTNVWVKNTVTGNTQQVSAMPTDQMDPALANNYITWTQVDLAIPGSSDQIYVRNLKTGNVGPLALNPTAAQENSAISMNQTGAVVVWQDSRNVNTQIFWKQIGAVNTGTAVTAAPGVDQTNPDVDGNMIVWQQAVAGVQKVFYMNQETLATGQVNTGTGSAQNDPAVSGANVVYTQGSGFFTKIWITNLDVLQLIPAVASHVLFNGVLFNSQHSADISGGKVVWTQITPLAVQQVMVLNLNTMNAALVTSTGVNQFDGAISNGIIVWTQGNTFFNAIYWRNTLNGQHGKLT